MKKRLRRNIALLLSFVFAFAMIYSPVNAEAPKTISIEVQYVKDDASKTVVAQPYKATIPLGYAETETVNLPKVDGFKATSTEPVEAEGFTLSEMSYTLDFSKFTADTKIQVVYKPETRPYTTERLFQNVEQTDYAVDESKTTTLNAKVGETVTATSANYPGFTEVKPLDSKVIPVDGTLNLQVKYNRNAYKITYNTDGGSYLTTDTKLFGSKLVKPEAPTKKGYTFLKWVDENGNEFDFTNKTMPAKDITLKAVWTEGENTPYRIAYYVQNADGNGYTAVAFVTKQGKTGDKVKLPTTDEHDPLIKYQFPGMEYWDKTVTRWMSQHNMTKEECEKQLVQKYFDKAYSYDDQKTTQENENKKVEGDGSTVVPIYFDRQVYTLIIGNDPAESGKEVVKIVKDGKTYDTKDNLYKFEVRFGQDFTEKMPKTENTPDLWNDNGFISDYFVLGNYDSDSWIYLGDHSPYILGFREISVGPWSGVGVDKDKNFPNVLLLDPDINDKHHDLKVNEHFQGIDGTYKNDIKTFTIPLEDGMWYYDANHEGFTKDQSYMTGVKEVKTPINPNNLEYLPNTSWVFLIKRATDSPAKPSKYDKIVTLDENGNEILGDPEPKGYNRDSDGEVHAYYKRNQYELRFHYFYEEESAVGTSKVYFEAPLIDNLPDATTIANNKPENIPEEYKFQGWYRDPGFQDDQKVEGDYKMPAYPIDLYAKWAPPIGDKTVTIDPDNGTGTTTATVKYGKKLDESIVGIPTKAGYDFVAWRVEGSDDNYDFNRPVYKDFTLKAIWKEKTISDVTIKFVNEADNSEVKEPVKVKDLLVDSDYSYEAPDIDKMWPDKIVKGIKVKADSAENVITFKYKPFTEATYSMRFITRTMEDGKDIETEISEATEVTTDKRIDTQNAKDISGYEPQTLQQTLRLAWDQKNVMTFVYKKADPNIAGYQIEYYFDKEGDGNFVLDKTKTKDYSGEVGRNVTLGEEQMPAVMDGLSLNKEKSDQSGIITSKPTLVLKVYYAVNKYTITVDPNGGNWNGNTNNIVEQHKEGSIFTLPKAPVRDGYTFLYWKGSEYNPGDKYTVTEDHTFTAIWEKNPNSNADKKKQSKEVAQTGDNAMAYAYASIIFVAIVGMFALRRVNKKEQ